MTQSTTSKPSIHLRFLVGLFVLTIWTSVFSQADLVEFDTPEQRLLYQQVIKELRCLVCQNQNLADSNAELAKDLRRKTFEMIRQDKNYDEIIHYMVERYGEFVLYRPRVTTTTLLLWFAPFICLFGVIIYTIRRNRISRLHSKIEMSDEDISKVQTLLKK